MSLGDLRIALVHDELTRRGGAEVVFEEMLKIFPNAEPYALYTGHPCISSNGKIYPIITTSLQHLPQWFRRHPGRLLPLLPYAAEQLDFSKYDLVISSASAFAKSIVTRANVPHLCYCHTPTRYLWQDTHNIIERLPKVGRWPAKILLHYLRLFDFAAAQRVDKFLANSNWTQQQITTYYRRESTVLYPPIDTAFFTPPAKTLDKTKAPFLCVGRLTPSKFFEHAIAVCEKMHHPLNIVGRGQHLAILKKHAGKYTKFVGKATSHELREYYRNARAVLQPGIEDFGMVAVEAQACGTPIIAYGVGGSQETVRPNETGVLYTQQTVEALAEAIRNFLELESSFLTESMQSQAMRFSRQRFKENLEREVVNIVGEPQRIPL